jgi:hypothetical protein
LLRPGFVRMHGDSRRSQKAEPAAIDRSDRRGRSGPIGQTARPRSPKTRCGRYLQIHSGEKRHTVKLQCPYDDAARCGCFLASRHSVRWSLTGHLKPSSLYRLVLRERWSGISRCANRPIFPEHTRPRAPRNRATDSRQPSSLTCLIETLLRVATACRMKTVRSPSELTRLLR